MIYSENMRQIRTLPRHIFVGLAMSSLFFFLVFPMGRAWSQTSPISPDEVQKKIDAKNQEIKQLEADAAKYRDTLGGIGRETKTLSGQIQTIDKSINGLAANVKVTNAKISKTQLEITELNRDIETKERSIQREHGQIEGLVTTLAIRERESPLEILMKNETMASFFMSLDNIVSVQSTIQKILATVRTEREALTQKKDAAEEKKTDLSSLVFELADQKALQEDERKRRAGLLAATKNQERLYQQLLTETQKKRDALEQEVNGLEAALNPNFDRSGLPAPGSGVLGWPLPEPIFVTQHFGLTSFARSGAYNGKGHNGVDFRASNGTPIFSTADGIVRSVGDTDLGCKGASYGRWVLVDHPNNLATLYAHLSLIKVKPGDGLNRGELVGYSGQTGYATGPHLHLSLFATHAVSVSQFRSKVCGRLMTLPIAPLGGYLDPIAYLPKL